MPKGYDVKFTAAKMEAVNAEMIKHASKHFKGMNFQVTCPKCSREITVSNGMNTCPSCKAEISFNLDVYRES